MLIARVQRLLRGHILLFRTPPVRARDQSWLIEHVRTSGYAEIRHSLQALTIVAGKLTRTRDVALG
jgi:hypothetical protein